MSNDGEIVNPFGNGLRTTESAGSRALQTRENAEVTAMIVSAKRFPRDVVRATDKILNAFTRVTLCEKAQYQFARGGSDIIGPSIRAAEAISQQWGNISNGWREVTRMLGHDGVGVSEVEAYSIDFESNTRESIQFYVRHWRDTRSGGYALKDERDIYELLANQSQRRKRACILAQVPGDIVEAAMDQVAVTLKASADTSPEAVAKIVTAFAELGISKDAIEKRIQRKVDAIQPAQVVSLKRIYASLRDEMSNPSDWFEVEPEAAPAAGLEAVRAAAKQKRAAKAAGQGGGADAPTAGAEAANEQRAEGTAAKPTVATAAVMSKHQGAIFRAQNAAAARAALEIAGKDVSPEQYTTLAQVYLKKWEPEAAAKPVFDEAAFGKRLQACKTFDAIDSVMDEVRDMEEGDVLARVTEVYRARRAALGE